MRKASCAMQNWCALQHCPAGQVATPVPQTPPGAATGVFMAVRSSVPGQALALPLNAHWQVVSQVALQRPYWLQHLRRGQA